MKIAIFSDSHCGYAFGDERGNDAFLALDECISRNLDADLILVAGDLFDSRIPKQEVFAKTAKILSKAQSGKSKARFFSLNNKDKKDISPSALRGVPIIAIHGTHERRSKHMINPVQALEHAGLLVHLHCGTIVFEISEEIGGIIEIKKVAIHGMSGVPEQYAKDVLLNWNPKPVPDALNIFLIHQSIEPYIYSPLDPPSLKLEDLPDGFDLYVLGHMHWRIDKNFREKILLLAGSITHTSIKKVESEQKKGFYVYNGKFLDFYALRNQRDVYWEEFELNQNTRKDLEDKLLRIKSGGSLKPLFFAKIRGNLSKDMVPPSFIDIEERFKDRAIVNIGSNFQIEKFEEQRELLRLFREQKLSAEEQGLRILRENLVQAKCGININEMFDLLVDGNIDMIYDLLTGRQKTLV